MNVYYKDDLVELWHGDALELTDWVNADVLVTDPPYGINWKGSGWSGAWGRKHPRRPNHPGITQDQGTAARDSALALWGSKPALVFGTWKQQLQNSKQVLVWKKPPDTGLIGSYTGYRKDTELIFLIGDWPKRKAARSSVLTNERGMNSYIRPGGHPHAKPVDLLKTLIEMTTGHLADPFTGSGSTLVAAKQLGRKAVGVELDERYCEMAAKRLEVIRRVGA